MEAIKLMSAVSPDFVHPPPQPSRRRLGLVAAAIILGVLAQWGVRQSISSAASSNKELPRGTAAPQTASVSEGEAATGRAIRFYSERVRRDPEDTRSQNALSQYYLQLVRESGNEDYLPLAIEAARTSLAAVVATRNFGGLTALAQAEFANHAFAAAREHALTLIELNPTKSEPYAILGDASLELGDYDAAATAFQKMQGLGDSNAGTETRLARQAILHGAIEEAQDHFEVALALLLALSEPPNETIAWCRWQLGETAFAMGDYATAERHYLEALKDAPHDFRALGAMGRVRAARRDFPGAISYYEEAVRIVPVVEFMAALGDLYQSAGRTKDAAVRYELVEQLSDHSRKVHGTPYDRRIALFLADHDRNPEEAYALAREEFDNGRRDVYGADALAWTALKSGRIAEAQEAMKEALRLGTRDAKLFYHAGMIARAAGEKADAASLLGRALTLNPEFDFLQAEKARRALESTRR